MNKEHTIWTEKYRPKNIDTFVGNKEFKDKVSTYLESGDIPNLLLTGSAGVGKTTLAKILVKHIQCDHIYVNASDERNIETIRNKVKLFASSIGFSPLKIIILDEFDFTTPQAQAALRALMETFAIHTRFILTCNYPERIIDPIQSRCQIFHLYPPSKKEVAIHVKDILTTENIEYNLKDVALYVNSGYPDMRRIINSLQKHVVGGELVVDTRSTIEADYKLKILDILKTQNKKDAFLNIRQLLTNNQIKDFTNIFRLLFDSVDEFSNNHTAECILILAEGQQSDSVVIDKEINMMATVIKLLEVIKK